MAKRKGNKKRVKKKQPAVQDPVSDEEVAASDEVEDVEEENAVESNNDAPEETEGPDTVEDIQTRMKEREDQMLLLAREQKKDHKLLDRAFKREMKAATKNKKKGPKRESNSGFNASKPVPPVLCELLDLEEGTELPRPKVTGLIHKYANENDLKDEDDKRVIHPDDALRDALGVEDGDDIGFAGLQIYLKKVYDSYNDELAEQEGEEDDDEETTPKPKKKKKKKNASANA